MPMQEIKEQYYLFIKEYFIQPNDQKLMNISRLGRGLVHAKVPPEKIAELQEEAIQRLNQEFPEAKLLPIIPKISGSLMKLLLSFGLAFREQVDERKQAEEMNARLAAIVENSDDAIIGKSLDGIITSWNTAAERMYGYSAEEAVGKPISITIPPDRPEELSRILKKIRQRQRKEHLETVRMRKDGKKIPVSVTVSPIKGRKGEIIGASSIVHDITKRKQAQEAIKKSEALYRTTLYSIGDAVITTDIQGKVQHLNPVAEQLTGWTEKNAAGKPLGKIFKIINEKSRKKVENPVTRVFREGIVVGLANHTLLISKDGKEIPIADSGAPIKGDKGEITGVVLVFRDQTEERKAQRAIEEARAYAESIIATVREPLIVLDGKLKVISTNRSFYQTFNVDEKETIGKYFYDFGNRQWDIPELRKLLEDILPQNTSFSDFEVEHEFENIGKRSMLLNARRIYREANKTQMVLLAIEDITKRKQVEEALQVSENRLIEAQKVAKLGHYVFDIKTGYWTSSAGLNAIFGIDENYKKDIAGWLQIVHPDYTETMSNHLQDNVLRQHQKFDKEYKIINVKTGQEKWVHGLGGLKFDDNNNPIEMFGTIQDVTEHKRAEKELRESEGKYRTLFNSIRDAILVADTKRNIIDCNAAFTSLFGYTLEEIKGKKTVSVYENEEEFKQLGKSLKEQYGNSSFLQVVNYKKKSGQVFPGETNIFYFKDDKQEVKGFIGLIRDITERKRAEEMLHQYEHIVSSSTDLLALLDKNFIYQAANKAYVDAFGLTRDELLYHCVPEIFGDEFFEKVIKPSAEKCLKGKVINYQEWFNFPAAGKQYMGINYYPYYDNNKEIQGFVVNGRNITEQKRAEEELKRRNKELETFNDVIVGRELKMIELKKEVNELLKKSGEKLKYEIPD